MKHLLLLPILFILTVCASARDENEVLREKMRLIERLQDSRTAVDSRLLGYLGDPDPAIRSRVLLAYGSLQDTASLFRLVAMLSDPDAGVQWSAAFAVGQTASMMGPAERQKWEYEIIRIRLDQMGTEAGRGTGGESPRARMIQELGKFCTADGLEDLILRQANSTPSTPSIPLSMAIARAAIRGVVTSGGTSYLLRFIRQAESIPWQVMYALQRVGDREEVRKELEYLVPIALHKNPLVRMNLASLWGKLKDGRTSLDPLIRMAEFDGDWRVRVNALRALANLDIRHSAEAIGVFRRAFSDPNLNISTTALTSFGGARLAGKPDSGVAGPALALLAKMAINSEKTFEWQVQGEAARSLARLREEQALASLPDPEGVDPILRYQLLLVLGETGNPDALGRITPFLNSDDPLMIRGALEALQTLCSKNTGNRSLIDRTYDELLKAIGEDDMAVRTTVASILGDSLFLRPSSVTPLLEMLAQLSVPNDTEVLQEVIATLGKLKDAGSIEALESRLQDADRSVVAGAAGALRTITGRDYSSSMRSTFEPLHTDFDFEYLESLPETVRVCLETIRGEIFIDLYKNMAPFTVMTVLKLAGQRSLYNGLIFHRVVPNFVIQGGDPRGDGWGGPGFAIRSEFVPVTFDAGAVGIASSGKDTEGCQFFIMHSPAPHLDGRYTLFGRVTSGMDVVNKIVLGDRIFSLKIVD
jgi:peptidylprolyl isomerase